MTENTKIERMMELLIDVGIAEETRQVPGYFICHLKDGFQVSTSKFYCHSLWVWNLDMVAEWHDNIDRYIGNNPESTTRNAIIATWPVLEA